MKAYTYCAIGSNKNTMTCVASGIGTFPSEESARNYLTDNFFKTNGVYPQRVEIIPVSRSMLQGLIGSCNDGED